MRPFDEIKAAGYEGGCTQLQQFVRQVRPTPPADPAVRFYTMPGQQAQVDFAEVRLPWRTCYALLAELGYPKLLWLRSFKRQTMAVLMCRLEEAFYSFGGVTSDQAPAWMGRTSYVHDPRLRQVRSSVAGECVECFDMAVGASPFLGDPH